MQELATSLDGSLLAGGLVVIEAEREFKSPIVIWDFAARKKIIEFKSCLQFGGERLAISNDGTLCAVGAYHRHGIVMHRVEDGSVLWQRKDLKKVQHLKFNPDGSLLLAVIQDRGGHVLDSRTGATVRKIRGCDEVASSPYETVEGVAYRNRGFGLVSLSTGKRFANLTLDGKEPVILDAVFSPDKVFVSEMRGPVSAYSTATGGLLWRYHPGDRGHFVTLGFGEETSTLWCILWHWNRRDPHLIGLCSEDGEVVCDLSSDVYDSSFAFRGRRMITEQGEVYDLTNPANPVVLYRLEFP